MELFTVEYCCPPTLTDHDEPVGSPDSLNVTEALAPEGTGERFLKPVTGPFEEITLPGAVELP